MKSLFIILTILLSTFLSASAQTGINKNEKLLTLPGADTSRVVKELIFLLHQNYIRGTIYFTGPGFSHTEMSSFSGTPYTMDLFQKATSGTKIILDKCIYIDDNKQRTSISKVFVLP
jgi:hypothetical protein